MGIDLDSSYNTAKRLDALERQVLGLLTRDVLQNSSIGLNGLLVNDGGGIRIEGGGSMEVTGGGSIAVSGGGTLFVDGIDISTIVGQSITPRVGSSSSAGILIPVGTYGTMTNFGFTVPAGYTRAVISVTGFVSGSSGSTGGERIYGRARIGANIGPESIQVWTVNEVAANVTATHSASLTGLTAGATIGVVLESHLQFGPSSNLFDPFNNANLVGMAMFLV